MNYNKVLMTENRSFIFPQPHQQGSDGWDRSETEAEQCKLLAATALKNLQGLGFTLSKGAFEEFSELPKKELIRAYEAMYAICADLVGTQTANAEVFYPNFPREVMEKSEAELYLNAILYYLGEYCLGVDLHEHEAAELRAKLLDMVPRDLKVINAGKVEDIKQLMANRMFSSTVLPAYKAAELYEWMKDDSEWKQWIKQDEIPNRVNKVNVALFVYRNHEEHDKNVVMSALLKDAVDVLRFASALSCKEGELPNIELTGKVRFHLSNREAKDVKNYLSKCKGLYQDVWRKKGAFKALGRAISMRNHSTPKRLKKAYDNLCDNKMVDATGKHIITPGFLIKLAADGLEKGELKNFEAALKKYPGEVTRQLIHCIDSARDERTKIAAARMYGDLCKNVPPATVLTMANYAAMKNGLESRVVRIGKANSYIQIPIDSEPLSKDVVEEILAAAEKVVSSYYKEAPDKNVGKVYIDPALKNHIVPGNDASNDSKGSVLTFGSKIEANEAANIKRLFLSWSGHFDVDLTADFMDEDMKVVSHASYYQLKTYMKPKDMEKIVEEKDENGNIVKRVEKDTDKRLIAIHSGDFVDAGPEDGRGVAEFVDMDVEKMKECGVKYASFTAHMFSSNMFSDCKNIKFGFMERDGKLRKEDAGFADRAKKEIRRLQMEDYDEDYEQSVFERPEFDYHCIPRIDEKTQQVIYEPSTVVACMDLAANASTAVSCIFDVDANKYLWVDKQLSMGNMICANSENNHVLTQMHGVVQRLKDNPTPNMYQMFTHYASAYGEITNDIKEADTVFVSEPVDRVEDGIKEDAHVISAYNLSEISSEIMVRKKAMSQEKDSTRTESARNEQEYSVGNTDVKAHEGSDKADQLERETRDKLSEIEGSDEKDSNVHVIEEPNKSARLTVLEEMLMRIQEDINAELNKEKEAEKNVKHTHKSASRAAETVDR